MAVPTSAPIVTRNLRIACICALGALALMTWQLFDPHVIPIIVAMSLGQILGTASFLLYLYAIALDFRKQRTETSDEKTALPK